MGVFTISQEKLSINLFIYPVGDLGSCIELTPVGDTHNYKCIDENKLVPDDDVTYNYWDSTASGIDMYTLPSDIDFIGTVNYIRVFARTKSHLYPQSSSGIFKILCSPSSICGTLFKSDDIDLTTGYQNYNSIWAENPATSIAWTLNDIKNLSIGIETSSPITSGATGQNVYNPISQGDLDELENSASAPRSTNWRYVLGGESYVHNFGYCDPAGAPCWETDLYVIPDHQELTGTTIDKITVFAQCASEFGGDDPVYNKIKIIHKYNGTIRYSLEFEVTSKEKVLFSKEWATNPDTGNPWTMAEIDDLQVGISIWTVAWDKSGYCYHLYMIVDYTVDANPEIRTTQCYLQVNYTSPSDSCTLNKPEGISVDHDRNIKMLNFWDGSREVYDLSRSSKTTILTGSEYQSSTCDSTCPCEHIMCVREMGKDGSIITLSGLSFDLFNGDYRIRSFGWKHISEKPEQYEWILELEDAD